MRDQQEINYKWQPNTPGRWKINAHWSEHLEGVVCESMDQGTWENIMDHLSLMKTTCFPCLQKSSYAIGVIKFQNQSIQNKVTLLLESYFSSSQPDYIYIFANLMIFTRYNHLLSPEFYMQILVNWVIIWYKETKINGFLQYFIWLHSS